MTLRTPWHQVAPEEPSFLARIVHDDAGEHVALFERAETAAVAVAAVNASERVVQERDELAAECGRLSQRSIAAESDANANRLERERLEARVRELEAAEPTWSGNVTRLIEEKAFAESEARALRTELETVKAQRQVCDDDSNKWRVESRALRERIERLTRWQLCQAEPNEDEDEPVYSGMLTDELGNYVRWEDVLEALRGS